MYNINMIEKRLRKLDYLYSPSNQEIYTPLKLVEEILDKLPTEVWDRIDCKWFNSVVKNGVWLGAITVRLVKNYIAKGIFNTEEEALSHIFSNQIYGYTLSKGALRIANKLLYGSNKYKGNIEFKNALEEDINMKFDVVIGNPPYQLPVKNNGTRKGSGNKLWHRFIEFAFDISKDDGIVSFITPAHWRMGNFSKNQVRKAQSKMWKYNFKYISPVSNEFSGVGAHMSLDAWIIDKSSPNTLDNEWINFNFIPVKKTTDHDNIKKFFNALINEKDFFVADIGDHRSYDYDCIRKKESGNGKFKYKHANTISQIKNGFYDWYSEKTDGFDNKKVIITNSCNITVKENYFCLYDSGTMGTGHASIAYTVYSDKDGKALENFINNSRVIRDIHTEYNGDHGYLVPLSIFKRIPKSFVERFNNGEDL